VFYENQATTIMWWPIRNPVVVGGSGSLAAGKQNADVGSVLGRSSLSTENQFMTK
jgi:hypothetical protein